LSPVFFSLASSLMMSRTASRSIDGIVPADLAGISDCLPMASHIRSQFHEISRPLQGDATALLSLLLPPK
jgi:hypothetical protein